MLEALFKKVSSKVDLICLPECVAIFTDKKEEINIFLEKFNKFFNFVSEQARKKKLYSSWICSREI